MCDTPVMIHARSAARSRRIPLKSIEPHLFCGAASVALHNPQGGLIEAQAS